MKAVKPNGLKFQHKYEKIYWLLSVLQKTLICPFKRLQTAMRSGKIDIRHIFCYGELVFLCLTLSIR